MESLLSNCKTMESFAYVGKIAEYLGDWTTLLRAIERMNESGREFDLPQCALLTNGFKSVIEEKYDWWKRLRDVELRMTAEADANELSSRIQATHAYREVVGQEVIRLTRLELDLLEKHYKPKLSTNEDHINYGLFQADCFYWLSHVLPEEQRPDVIDKQKMIFDQCLGLARDLDVLNTKKLALHMNYAIFLYDIMNEKEEALSMCMEASEKAVSALPNANLDEEQGSRAESILTIMKDNLLAWQQEMYVDMHGLGGPDEDNPC